MTAAEVLHLLVEMFWGLVGAWAVALACGIYWLRREVTALRRATERQEQER